MLNVSPKALKPAIRYPARLGERNLLLLPWYDQEFLRMVKEHGGIFNAHAHLCRACTLEPAFLQHINTTPLDASSLPLSVKQNLVGDLHNGIGYTSENLEARMSYVLRMQIALGVTRLDTNIDATPDLSPDGLRAIRIALELKKKFAHKIDLRIAPTPIFGFKKDPRFKRSRWEVFEEASGMSDYLSLLPEKDDDDEVGFKKHIRMGLELACLLGKEVQFHLDQANIDSEAGTERLLEVLEVLDIPVVPGARDTPTVWVIHMISPSAYNEYRFKRLVEKLLKYNVGVIVCPTAAISMRQLRCVEGPTHNSIARVLELIKSRVPIRLGTDNIADVFVPQSDGDMLSEIKFGGHSVRMAPPNIWAKLASGTPPTNVDIATVARIIREDIKSFTKINPNWIHSTVE